MLIIITNHIRVILMSKKDNLGKHANTKNAASISTYWSSMKEEMNQVIFFFINDISNE